MKIVSRYDPSKVLFEFECESIRECLEKAVAAEANLRSADLSSANLRFADLSSADLPEGIKWEQYLSEVVPALLTATGKKIEDVIATKCWECHDWSNCPMHVVFDGINSPDQGPILLRPRIEQFVQFFDAGLIPCPVVAEQEKEKRDGTGT